MNRLLIFLPAMFLQACVNQVQLAKQEMDAAVLRDSSIRYRDINTYPGNVVCGRYSTSRKNRENSFSAFIYRATKINTRPSTLDIAIFCSEDSRRNFSLTTGIDMAKCDTNRLPNLLGDFRTIATALSEYETDNGEIPRDRQGLSALNTPSSVPPIPRRFRAGGYLSQIPSDPWGNAYLYRGPVFGGSKGQYSLTSLGADGVVGGVDDNADVSTKYLKYIDHIGSCGS